MSRIIPALVFMAVALSTTSAATPEKWADPALPVRDGLQLWLDAGRAVGENLVPHDGKLVEWLDASGNRRHLRQPTPAAQPTRLPAGGGAVVRFDGAEQYLRAVKQGVELKSFTVILVVAPRQNLGPFRGFMAFNAAGRRDYESGLNIDMGPTGTPRFSAVNVEGPGFSGAVKKRRGTTSR
jgi:hypothetical protein